MKLLILANFRVMAPLSGGGEEPIDFKQGMIVDEADVPENSSADVWIEHGLAERATA